MKKATLPFLCCPACSGALDLAGEIEWLRSASGALRIRRGVLACVSCGTKYPILDCIPRLVRPALFSPEELAALQQPVREAILPDLVLDMGAEERQATIQQKLRSRSKIDSITSPALRRRAEHDLEYRLKYTEKKEKVVDTAAPYLSGPPRAILEVGGGQGGLSTCFRKRYLPEVAISVDLDVCFSEVSVLRDPEVQIIRADATNLPIRTGAVDLVITTSVLEHIPDWRRTVAEISRVSKQALIGYGPNGLFGYDWGHSDAFVVWFLPRAANAALARLWHALRRTGRSYASLRKEMDGTFYLPRFLVTRELRKYGRVRNVFRDFMRHSVNADYHYIGGRAKVFLSRHPRLLDALTGMLVAAGVEPMVYLFSETRPR